MDIIVTGGKNNGDTLKSAENITITPLTFNVKQITSRTLNVMYILYFYQCRISVIVIKSAKKTPQLIIMTFMTQVD